MLIKEKLGNLKDFDLTGHTIDRVLLEWYETNKRILHKRTEHGQEVVMKFFKENQNLQQDDVVYKDDDSIIAIDINACDAIILHPSSTQQLAALCYEIGNKHLPLFYEEGMLMLPFEEPLFRWLLVSGYEPQRQQRKLSRQLRTSVAAHGHSGSLFSKILQLTSASNA